MRRGGRPRAGRCRDALARVVYDNEMKPRLEKVSRTARIILDMASYLVMGRLIAGGGM